jgi:hypothetical protein
MNLLQAASGLVVAGWVLVLAASFWIIAPLRRWSLRWPLCLLLAVGVLSFAGGVALSTSFDVYFWSPLLLAGFALGVLSAAALVVRLFEWYLWAWWR